MLMPLFLPTALRAVLGSSVTFGSWSAILGWTWEHSLCVFVQLQLPQMLRSLLTAPDSRCIRFIRLLLFVLTHAHLLRAGILRITHGRPRARRIRWMVCRCSGHRGVSGSGDVPAIYCARDSSVFEVCFVYLESRGGFDS